MKLCVSILAMLLVAGCAAPRSSESARTPTSAGNSNVEFYGEVDVGVGSQHISR